MSGPPTVSQLFADTDQYGGHCPRCRRRFGTDHGLAVHIGRAHRDPRAPEPRQKAWEAPERARQSALPASLRVALESDAREWTKRAACVGADPELWFPTRGESTGEAKAICRDCPVCPECLDYALANRETFGIWGGRSERERRRMRRVA